MAIKKDDELDGLEEAIRKVKNKYDQFFSGIQKVPPMHDRRNVEVLIYEIGKQKMRENARRFRYNTLLSRYNQYREMWGRKMREREEGPLDFRRRAAALAEPSTPPPPPPAEKARQVTQMVEKQSEVVRTRYNVNAVAFRVETVDGKVKLKAKPVQE